LTPGLLYPTRPGTCPVQLRVASYKHFSLGSAAADDWMLDNGAITCQEANEYYGLADEVVAECAKRAGLPRQAHNKCHYYDEDALDEAIRTYGPKDDWISKHAAIRDGLIGTPRFAKGVESGRLVPIATYGKVCYYERSAVESYIQDCMLETRLLHQQRVKLAADNKALGWVGGKPGQHKPRQTRKPKGYNRAGVSGEPRTKRVRDQYGLEHPTGLRER
jgi:hypothetical protein